MRFRLRSDHLRDQSRALLGNPVNASADPSALDCHAVYLSSRTSALLALFTRRPMPPCCDVGSRNGDNGANGSNNASFTILVHFIFSACLSWVILPCLSWVILL